MSRESVSIVLSVNCLQGYERQIREQMTDMFAASGFDAKRDIAGMFSTAGATRLLIRSRVFSSG